MSVATGSYQKKADRIVSRRPLNTRRVQSTVRVTRRISRLPWAVLSAVAVAGVLGVLALNLLDRRIETAGTDRAALLFEEGNLAAGLVELDRAIEAGRNDALTFRTRAWVRTELGDVEGAISDYDLLLAQDMLDAEAYASRGSLNIALARLGEGDPVEHCIRAIEDYERAIGVGGEDWAGTEACRALQDAARARLNRELDNNE